MPGMPGETLGRVGDRGPLHEPSAKRQKLAVGPPESPELPPNSPVPPAVAAARADADEKNNSRMEDSESPPLLFAHGEAIEAPPAPGWEDDVDLATVGKRSLGCFRNVSFPLLRFCRHHASKRVAETQRTQPTTN